MAEKLARRYDVSRAKARIAGVLHDLARHWASDELLVYAHEHGLPLSKAEQMAPLLLHARVGADLARREFGVTDADTLAAIATHTVPAPGMSDFQKIVFMADTFEPNRRLQARAALEAAALRSLDEGMLACVKASIDYLLRREVPIAPETVEVYNQLVKGQ